MTSIDTSLIEYIKEKYSCQQSCQLFEQGSIKVPHYGVESIDIICKECGRMFNKVINNGCVGPWQTSWEIEDNEKLTLDNGST